jgi:UDP-GlcNAc:undecaprenyl-phosphate GlcNAc-1-phosphate transferase
MRLLILLLTSFTLSLIFGLALAKIAPRIGLMDAPDRPRKIHPRPVPLVGGLAIWLAVMVTIFAPDQPEEIWTPWYYLSLMGVVGLVDDWLDLSAWVKLLAQTGVALLILGIGFKEAGLVWVLPNAGLILCVLWLVFVTNIVNYTDNCNGLCGGLGVIILAGFACVFWGDEPWYLLLLVIAATGGFLVLNFPRGRIFLGDAGSHLLGILIAWLSLMVLLKSNSLTGLLCTLLFIAVPLVDFLQVSIGRMRRGQPIWEGDTCHLSHLLVRRGYTPVKAVVILWVAATVGVAVVVVLVICFG